MNHWIELLTEVQEMRKAQKAYFKNKDKSKTQFLMAASKLCEMKVDQLTGKLEEICREKGIDITKPNTHEPTE